LPVDVAGLRARYERSLARELTDEVLRIEPIDRALALASKLFVAVIPLSILISAVVPGADNFGESLVRRFELTGAGRDATLKLFATNGTVRGGVTVIGLVILLYSTFSFTRGLQKVYLDVWRLPPQRLEALIRRAVWVIGFVVFLAVLAPVRTFGSHHHLRFLYGAVAVTLNAAFWAWTPYVLLGARLEWRRLVPTGLLTALGVTIFAIASAIYMPVIMTHNATRYGLIGVAFGLVTWLFVYAGVVIACIVVGHSWDVHHGGEEPTDLPLSQDRHAGR
jgi:membrane protein